MALHDREAQDIIGVDPCHKFTWCLDACIREKNVDVKRSRELQVTTMQYFLFLHTSIKLIREVENGEIFYLIVSINLPLGIS